jgi:hypothetical protein
MTRGGREAVDGTSAGFEKLGRARTGQENLGVRGGWVTPKIQSETGLSLVHFSVPAAAKPEQMDLLQLGIKFVELLAGSNAALPTLLAALFHLGLAARSTELQVSADGCCKWDFDDSFHRIYKYLTILFHPLFKHQMPGMDPSTTLLITRTRPFQTSRPGIP